MLIVVIFLRLFPLENDCVLNIKEFLVTEELSLVLSGLQKNITSPASLYDILDVTTKRILSYPSQKIVHYLDNLMTLNGMTKDDILLKLGITSNDYAMIVTSPNQVVKTITFENIVEAMLVAGLLGKEEFSAYKPTSRVAGAPLKDITDEYAIIKWFDDVRIQLVTYPVASLVDRSMEALVGDFRERLNNQSQIYFEKIREWEKSYLLKHQEILDLKQKLAEFENTVQTLSLREEELLKQDEENNATIRLIQDRLANDQKDGDKKQSENDRILSIKNATISELSSQKRFLESDNSTYHNLNDDLTEQISLFRKELNNRLEKLTAEDDALLLKIRQWWSATLEQDQLYRDLSARYHELLRQEELLSRANEINSQLDLANTKLSETDSNLQSKIKVIKELEDAINLGSSNFSLMEEKYKEQFQEMETMLNNESSYVKKLEGLLARTHGKIMSLQSRLKSKNEFIEALQAKLVSEEATSKSLRNTLENTDRRAHELEINNRSLSENIAQTSDLNARLEQEKEELTQTVTTDTKTIEELSKTIVDKESKLNLEQSRIKGLLEKIKRLTKRKRSLSQQKQSLGEIIARGSKENFRLKNDNAKLLDELDKMLELTKSEQAEKEDLLQTLAASTKTIEELEKEKISILTAKQSEIDKLSQTNGDIQTQNESLQASLIESEQIISNLQSLTRNYQELKDQIQDQQKTIHELNAQINERDRLIAELKERNSAYDHQVSGITDTNTKLEKALQDKSSLEDARNKYILALAASTDKLVIAGNFIESNVNSLVDGNSPSLEQSHNDVIIPLIASILEELVSIPELGDSDNISKKLILLASKLDKISHGFYELLKNIKTLDTANSNNLDQLKQELEDISKELESSRADSYKKDSLINKLKKQIATLKSKWKLALEENDNIKQSLTEKNREAFEQNQELARQLMEMEKNSTSTELRLKNINLELEKELAQLRGSNDSKSKQIANLEHQLTTLESNYEEERKSNVSIKTYLDDQLAKNQEELNKEYKKNQEFAAKLLTLQQSALSNEYALSQQLKLLEQELELAKDSNSTNETKITNLEQEVARLKAKVKQEHKKREEISGLLAESKKAALLVEQSLRNNNLELATNVDNLKNNISSKNETIAKLEQQINDLKRQLTDLESNSKEEKASSITEYARLNDQLLKVQETLKQEQEDNQKLKTRLLELEQESLSAKNALQNLNESLETELAASKENDGQKESIINKLKQRIAKLNTQTRQESKKSEGLSAILLDTERYSQLLELNLQNRNMELLTELSDLKSSINIKNEKIAKLQQQLANARAKRNAIKEQTAREFEELTNTNSALNAQLSSIEASLSDISAQKDLLAKEVSTLKTESGAKDDDLSQKSSTIKSLESQRLSIAEKLVALTKKYDDLVLRSTAYKSSNESRGIKIRELNDQILTLENSVSHQTELTAEAKRDLDSKKDELEKLNDSNRQQLLENQKLTARAIDLEGKLSSMSLDLESMLRNNDELSLEIHKLLEKQSEQVPAKLVGAYKSLLHISQTKKDKATNMIAIQAKKYNKLLKELLDSIKDNEGSTKYNQELEVLAADLKDRLLLLESDLNTSHNHEEELLLHIETLSESLDKTNNKLDKKAEELGILTTKNNEANSKLNELEDQLSKAFQENQELRSNLDSLNGRLTTTKSSLQDALTKTEALNKNLNNLTTMDKQKSDDLIQMRKNFETTNTERKSLLNEVEAITKKYEQTQAELLASITSNNTLKQEITDLQQQISTLNASATDKEKIETELKSKKDELTNLNDQYLQKVLENQNLATAIIDLEGKLSLAALNLEDTLTRNNDLLLEISSLKDEKERSTKLAQTYKTLLEIVKSKKNTATNIIATQIRKYGQLADELTTTLAETDARNAGLENMVSNLNAKVSFLKSDLEASLEYEKELQGSIDALTATLTELNDKLNQKEEEIAELIIKSEQLLTKETNEHQKKLNDLNRKIGELSEIIAEQADNELSLVKQYETLSKELTKTKDDLITVQDQFVSKQLELNKQLSKLEREKELLNKQLKEAASTRQEADDYKEQLALLREKMTLVEEEKARLTKQLDDLTDSFSSQTDNLTALTKKIDASKAKIAALKEDLDLAQKDKLDKDEQLLGIKNQQELITKQLAESKQSVESLSAYIKKLTSDNQSLNNANSVYETKEKVLQESISKLSTTLDDLQSKYNMQTTQVQELEEALQKANTDQEANSIRVELVNELTKTIKELQHNIQTLTGNNNALLAENKILDETAAKLYLDQQEFDELQRTNELLSAELSALHKLIESTKNLLGIGPEPSDVQSFLAALKMIASERTTDRENLSMALTDKEKTEQELLETKTKLEDFKRAATKDIENYEATLTNLTLEQRARERSTIPKQTP